MKDQEARNEIQRVDEKVYDSRVRIDTLEHRLDRQIQMIHAMLKYLGLKVEWVNGTEAHYVITKREEEQ